MAIRTRVVVCDGSGAGNLGVPPCYFAGVEDLDPGTVSDSYDQTWTEGMVPRDEQTATNGELTIGGAAPGAKVILFFDF